jgi:type II secretory pathway component PulF
MDTASLDDLSALNEQLSALADAGVPLDIALGDADRPAAKDLERIRATVARRMNRGESLEQALEGDNEDVPASYRGLLQVGIHTGDFTTALDGSSRVAESLDDSRSTLQSAFVYPLVICMLAYIGLVGFCLYLVPVLQGLYESVRVEPGWGLRILQLLRDTLPYWVAIPPILMMLIVAAWQRSKPRSAVSGAHARGILGWLPGARRSLFQERCASFSASLKELLDVGTPFDEALRIAGDATNDPNLRAGASLLAADVRAGGLPSDNSRVAQLFPRFLRWAIWHADETTGRGRALEIAARMYREAADRRAERLRIMAPIVGVVLVGSTVVLGYGLALFVPFTELLRSLAS